MRGLLVAGMMAAAGAAWGQEANWKSAQAIGAVASVTAGAAWCSYEIHRDNVEIALKSAGFDRSNGADVSNLDLAFAAERMRWSNWSQSPDGKNILSKNCAQLNDAYGPSGTVRKSLLSTK